MTAAADALSLLGHLRVDATSDQLLEDLITGFTVPFERAHLVAHGDSSMEPWAALSDPRVAPLWALPHVAVRVGGILPGRRLGETDEAYLARARNALIYPRGQRRGGIGALTDHVRETLTGAQRLVITEYAAGNPYAVVVQTIGDETPDPAATAHAVMTAPIAAELMPAHDVITGQTWNQLAAGDRTWTDAAAIYMTWNAAGADQPATP